MSKQGQEERDDRGEENREAQEIPRLALERAQGDRWVKVCPRCLSPNLRPLTSISGFLVQDQWLCEDCGYAGIAIEADVEDLEEINRARRTAKWFTKNDRRKASDNPAGESESSARHE